MIIVSIHNRQCRKNLEIHAIRLLFINGNLVIRFYNKYNSPLKKFDVSIMAKFNPSDSDVRFIIKSLIINSSAHGIIHNIIQKYSPKIFLDHIDDSRLTKHNKEFIVLSL